MNANRKLFLSAVSSEFEGCRKLLATDLKRPTLDVAVQENFGVGGGLIGSQKSEVGSRSAEGSGPAFAEVDAREELVKARALIEHHGYWRRREQLADAEAAALHWE